MLVIVLVVQNVRR